MDISLCMIVKDEENCLDNCLRSIQDLADEIIIVDTGSTDGTKKIAARYTDKIYDFTWIDDFAAARNFSFSKATGEYCMWLDADDILTEESRISFTALKKNLDSDVDVVLMPYHYSFTEDGRLERSFVRERIVKRSNGFQWKDVIHESIDFSGNVFTSDIIITHTKQHHDNDRNFLILESAFKKGNANLKTLYYYAAELSERSADEGISLLERFFAQDGYSSLFCLDACIRLHNLYLDKKQYDKALKISMDCLPLCLNRSEFCCQLGYLYAHIIQDLNEAVYWFDMATKCPFPDISGFSIEQEFYYYKPYLLLGKTYFMQGRYREGLSCFREALQYYPGSIEARQCMLAANTKLLEYIKSKKDSVSNGGDRKENL